MSGQGMKGSLGREKLESEPRTDKILNHFQGLPDLGLSYGQTA